MEYVTWALAVVMFFYSASFSVTLWKEKNKPGSIVIMIFALFTAVGPYFVMMK
jgi:hypothetical protein